jgi:hypothetical protein
MMAKVLGVYQTLHIRNLNKWLVLLSLGRGGSCVHCLKSLKALINSYPTNCSASLLSNT